MDAENDNEELPASWSEARDKGSKFYFPRIPCPLGHICPRRFVSRACVECDRLRAKERARKKREDDPEAVNAYKREQRIKNPKVRETERAYREAHPEQTKASKKRAREKADPVRMAKHRQKWAESNPEKVKEIARNYRINNPEKARAIVRNRQARKKGNGGKHTAEDIEEIHARQKYKCAECGVSTKKKRHVDHIMPLKLGGSNGKENLQILCPRCNQRKNDLHPVDWAKKQGRLV